MPNTVRGQAEEVFQEAADLPPGMRSGFLDERCGDDHTLRDEVESLLACFSESRIASLRAVELRDESDTDLVGREVGPYRLLEVIGEGGFGTVYLGEQTEPIRRKVAVKVIKLGMDTKQVIARFEAERQALALMDHTHIAKVYDAGATMDGRPYFAMELLRGVPITKYCDEHQLSVRQRLALFAQVCRAVQHAHQKGVIHRDIKPSNVLVTLQDGEPSPKIIDFGIAKATCEPLVQRTLFTAFRQLMGTPEYMSPEQVEMSELGVDSRSDVYSLGVVLYELLTGTTPIDRGTLRNAALTDVERTIREVEPPKPSRRVSTPGPELMSVARHRQTEPRGLRRLIRGDLDWIVMKALEKDRTRRYDSASAFAADIERYLNNEPVLAGPPGAVYQFRKLIVRHKAPFGFLAALLVLLTGFGVWMSLLYARADSLRLEAEDNLFRAQNAEKRAQTEAKAAQEIVDFLVGLFAAPHPLRSQGSDVLAREILDRGARRIRDELDDQPETQATLMDTIGHVYANLGMYDDAVALLRRALAIRRERLGPEHALTLSTTNSLARALMFNGGQAEAEHILREAMAIGRRTLGDDHRETVKSMTNLAWALQSEGRLAEAEVLYRKALAIQRRVLGNDELATLASVGSLAWVLEHLRKFEEAEALAREALETTRRLHGDDHLYTADAMGVLGTLLMIQDRTAEAEPMLRGAEALHRRILGDEHPMALQSTRHLVMLLQHQGKLEDAEEHCRQLLTKCRRVLGDDDELTLQCASQLGGLLLDQDKLAVAEAVLREALASLRQKLGEQSRHTVVCTHRLGQVLVGRGQIGEGQALLHDALEWRARLQGVDPVSLFDEVRAWCDVQWVLGEPSKTESLLRLTLEGLRRSRGEDDRTTRQAEILLALAHTNKDEVGRTEGLLREFIALVGDELSKEGWQPTGAKIALGRCLVAQARYGEAEPLLLASHAVVEAKWGKCHALTQLAVQSVLDLYDAWDRPAQAAAWKAKLGTTPAGPQEVGRGTRESPASHSPEAGL